MIKHYETSDPNSCLNRAALNEPVFVLRANDRVAPSIIREWANRYSLLKRLENADGGLTERQQEKLDAALKLADDMESWRNAKANAESYGGTG